MVVICGPMHYQLDHGGCNIDSHVVKMSATFAMDSHITKLFYHYACNLPLNIADLDQFVNVVKMLRPG